MLRMRPMSLFETGVSTGQVSLRKLFDGDFTPSLDPGVTVPALVNCIVTGGWPALLEVPVRAAQRWISDYVRTIRNLSRWLRPVGVKPLVRSSLAGG